MIESFMFYKNTGKPPGKRHVVLRLHRTLFVGHLKDELTNSKLSKRVPLNPTTFPPPERRS